MTSGKYFKTVLMSTAFLILQGAWADIIGPGFKVPPPPDPSIFTLKRFGFVDRPLGTQIHVAAQQESITEVGWAASSDAFPKACLVYGSLGDKEPQYALVLEQNTKNGCPIYKDQKIPANQLLPLSTKTIVDEGEEVLAILFDNQIVGEMRYRKEDPTHNGWTSYGGWVLNYLC